MKIFRSAEFVTQDSDLQKDKGKTIGFVPTMGALHSGHIALAEKSISDGHYTFFSIFVNPKQFNDPKDLELYPRTIEKDLDMLYKCGMDAVYCPSPEDVFQSDYVDAQIQLGNLEHVLEGAMRPGHFIGVARVVKRLFEIVRPDHAYFGQKDYQQTAVIQKLIELCKFNVNMHICPIIREPNGLAMSSRNERLSPAGRKKAGFVYQALLQLKEDVKTLPLTVAIQTAKNEIMRHEGAVIEYLEVVDGIHLSPLKYIEESRKPVALVVVRYEEVRLLDNILL